MMRQRAGAFALTIAFVAITLTPTAALAVAPVVVDDDYTVAEDVLLTVGGTGVLGNDTPGDGGETTVAEVAGPDHGTLSLQPDGSFTYLPDSNWFGDDAFTYEAVAGGETSGSAVVTIHVTAVNDAPVGVADTPSVNEDATLNVGAPGVLGNDTDVDSASLTAILVGNVSHGTLNLNATGSYTYTPTPNYSGPDNFTYRASDGDKTSGVTTVTLTVNGINDPPVAGADSYSTPEDVPLIVPAPGLLGNDSDPDPGTALQVVVSAGPTHGTLDLGTSGAFTYTPASNYNGSDSFTYRAFDGTAYSNTVSVSLTINVVNDPPTTVPDAYSTNEDSALNRNQPAVGVLANDSDPEGNSFTATLVGQATSGTVSNFGSNGTFRYTPVANFNGTATFTYRATDSLGAPSALTTVTITVIPINDLPIAVGDSGTTTEDTPLVTAALALTTNDSDLETPDAGLVANAVSQPFHGAVVVNADGSYTYTPAANYSGIDSFTYRVTDADGGQSNVATVSLTVTPVNDAPVAVGDIGSTGEDTALVVAAPGVLGNDSDVDGQALTASVVSGPAHGTLTLNANGSYTYTPATGYEGPDGFTYRASDGTLFSNTATVSLTVDPVNDAPVAVNDNGSTNEDTPLVVATPGLLANDTDVDSAILTASVAANPSHGTLNLNANGSYTYTPAANYNGPDSFSYRASDGSLLSNTATVSLTVLPVSDPPVAVDDARQTNEDTVLNGASVLGNDADPDAGTTLQAVIDSSPARGSLILNANGTFSYTPLLNDTGSVTFTYHATDGTLSSSVATVTITIAPVNDVPVAVADSGTTAEDVLLAVAAPGLKSNDADVETATTSLTASLWAQATHGTAAVNTDGSWSYQPAANYNGPDSFSYRVFDGATFSTPATVTLTVTAVNDAPVGGSDAYASSEDTPLVVAAGSGVLVDDSDVESSSLTALLVAAPNHGTLSLQSNGAFTYTPAADYNGADSFTYRASDGSLQSGVTVVSLSVAAVNDPPSFTLGVDPSVAEDSGAASYTGFLTNVSPGPSDEVGQTTSLSVVAAFPLLFATQPAISGAGTLTFRPAANVSGSSTVTVTVTDDGGVANGGDDSGVKTFLITVTGANDPVDANSDSWMLDDEPPVWIETGIPTTLDVLANDVTPDIGETLTILSVTKPSHGTITIAPDTLTLSYRSTIGYVGADSFKYTMTDGVNTSNQATVSLSVRDTLPPTLGVPTFRFDTGAQLTSTVKVRLAWSASDPGSGVKSYDVQRSTNGGLSWTTIYSATTATSATRSHAFGTAYTYRFRARDKGNRTSGWSTTTTFTPARYQESTGLAAYSSGWRTASISSASGDKTRYAKAAGSTSTFSFTGRAVSLVAPRSSGRGKAEIRVDGVLVSTVNLYHASTQARRHVWSRSWGSVGPHVVTVKVLGTSGHPRFDIDAWTVLK